MRERLIELIGAKICEDYSPTCDEWQPHSCEKCYANNCRIGDLADYLLENGVVVPPCKVGDKTFLLLEKVTGGYDIIESECVRIIENKYSRIFSMAFDCEEIGNTLEFHLEDFERWVFLTREDAERALRKKDEANEIYKKTKQNLYNNGF